MTWVTPMVGVLFGAIAIPMLLLFYFLRLRRHSIKVPSTMLWTSSVEDLHANTPFQRLRPSTLLLLQLLALLLVVLAMMQPQIEGNSPKAGKHVFLIDRSSSMNTIDANGVSRFEEAKAQAMDLIDQLHGGGIFAGDGGETMVITFSDHAEIVIPFTDSKQQLIHSIQSIEPTHGDSLIEDALKLARAYTTNVNPEEQGISTSEAAQLELFSDGNIADISTQALQHGESMHFHSVGNSDTENIGIQNISIKRLSESSQEVQLFMSLVNTGDANSKIDITIYIDGVPISVEQVEVSPSVSKGGVVDPTNVVFVPFSLPNGGLVRAAIDSRDAYEIDNEAWLIVPPPRELEVLLIENGPPIVKTVLEGMQLQSLKQIQSAELVNTLNEGNNSFDVVITRGTSFDELPQGRYVIFGPPPPIDAFNTFVDGDQQLMLVAKEEHPVMRFVRYEDIVSSKGFHVISDDRLETLLEGSSWPAILYFRDSEHEIVYIAFDPIESNWPYLRSFPFFIYNSVQFLGRKGDALISMPREVGQSLTQSIEHGVEVATIQDPLGGTLEVKINKDGELNWGPIRYSGIHKIETSQNDFKVVVKHPSEESIIKSKSEVAIGVNKITSSPNSTRSYIALWPWALGCVLIVLILEWWVYQKKVSGSGTRSISVYGGDSAGIEA